MGFDWKHVKKKKKLMVDRMCNVLNNSVWSNNDLNMEPNAQLHRCVVIFK